MANVRGWLVLAGAVGLGLAAAKGAAVFMEQRVATEVAGRVGDTRPQTEVLVARHDLTLSSKVAVEDVELVRVPEELIPPTALRNADDAIGRVTRARIYAGEPLIDARLAPRGARGGLQAVIPEGMRAMTVKVNDVIGVAGFILPGAHVDVVAVMKPSNSAETQLPSFSKVVLQNTEVLAVDQIVETVDEKPVKSSAITLLVTPSDSERLALSVSQGEIQLVMRAFADEDLVATGGIDAVQLSARPVAGLPQQSHSVEVIQNNKKTRTSVKTSASIVQIENARVQ